MLPKLNVLPFHALVEEEKGHHRGKGHSVYACEDDRDHEELVAELIVHSHFMTQIERLGWHYGASRSAILHKVLETRHLEGVVDDGGEVGYPTLKRIAE